MKVKSYDIFQLPHSGPIVRIKMGVNLADPRLDSSTIIDWFLSSYGSIPLARVSKHIPEHGFS